MIKAVLFDLDDTLLNSIPSRVNALGYVFREAGITHLDPEHFFYSMHGSSLEENLARLAETCNIQENLFNNYRRAYWFKVKGSNALYPGVAEMLDNLKVSCFTLGIVTSKFRDSAFEGGRTGCMIELERTGINDLFSVIIGLEDVLKPKPDPECIRLALEKTGTAPAHTLVVGDSAADIAAAKAAGCKSCHAVWGLPVGFQISESAKPDFTARTPDDIIRILKHVQK